MLESKSILAWLPLFAIIAACYFILDKFLNLPHVAEEPPLIPQPVPFIGHLLGILRHGSSYYSKISNKYSDHPIYTLRLPFSKIYIVSSPAIVSAVDRQAKYISFAPCVVQFAKRILIASPKGLEALAEDLEEKNGAHGVRSETLKVMHDALAPGEDLENTTRAMLRSLSRVLESAGEFQEEGEGELFLFDLIRRLVTTASTDAIYGADKNPFRDPEVEKAFWAIDKDFAYLGLNIFPHLLAPHGSRSRQRLFQGFHSYYASNGHETGSRVIQARYEVNRKHGISLSDIEHFDLSVCYALLINTVPAASWVLYHLYSSHSLLKEVRETISSYIRTTQDALSNGALVRHVNIAEVVAGYPFLGAFVQETLRVQSTNASARIVLRDILTEDRYLLKKDSFLLIPSADLHSNPAIWGPSVASFDPQRFLQKSKVPASAYRAYGSGASVCPGRYFAANEILIILIVMVCKYDLRPRGVVWKVPESKPHITKSILTPVGDLEVKLVEREDGGSGTWRFSWDRDDFVKRDY